MIHPREGRVSTKIIWNFYTQRFVYFPLINLFSHLFTSALTHEYLFYTLDCNKNTKLFILLFELFQLCHWKIIQLVSVSLISFQGFCFFFFNLTFPYFLAQQGDPGSSCMCSALVFKLAFSQESWFVLLKNGINYQNLGISCTHCYRGSIAFRLSQLTKQKILHRY